MYTALLYGTCDLTQTKDDVYVHIHKAAATWWQLIVIIIIITATAHQLLSMDLKLSPILHIY